MNKINTLVLCKDDYNTQEKFENAIRDAVMILLDSCHIMTVRYDANEKEFGVVCIDYNKADQTLGEAHPFWLSTEEWESVVWDDEREDGE